MTVPSVDGELFKHFVGTTHISMLDAFEEQKKLVD